MTLKERLGDPRGKRFVLTGHGIPGVASGSPPVQRSRAHLGMEIVIARPDGYELDPETALIGRSRSIKVVSSSHHQRSRRRRGRSRRGVCEILGIGEAVGQPEESRPSARRCVTGDSPRNGSSPLDRGRRS
jgi:hypothetical protein